MSEPIDYSNIMSPCNNRCKNDFENTYCISCFRTIEEKRTWWKFSKEEKKKILSELEYRSKTW